MKPAFKKLNCHLIFEVKLSENFRRKARFITDGHRTKAPKSLSYSMEVSRDSVRIAFLLAALNNLQVVSCDIKMYTLMHPVVRNSIILQVQSLVVNKAKPT